jgi:quinol monooxygenase YgiN
MQFLFPMINMSSPSVSYTGKQFTLFVTFHVAPDNIERFKEAHRPLWRHCADEPECLLFDVFQDLEEPGRFRFVEVWNQSREWFEKVRSRRVPVGGNMRRGRSVLMDAQCVASDDQAILFDSVGKVEAVVG